MRVGIPQPGGFGELPARGRRRQGRIGREPGEVGVTAPADGHRLGEEGRQSGERPEVPRLGRGVGVEEAQHVARACAHSEVAGGGEPEPAIILPNQTHPRRGPDLAGAAVVGDDDLDELGRVVLCGEGVEGAGEFGGLVEVGDDHRDPGERVGNDAVQGVPGVSDDPRLASGHPISSHHDR